MNSDGLVLVEDQSSMRVVSPLPLSPHALVPRVQTSPSVSYDPNHIIPPCSPSILNPAPACKVPFPLPLKNTSGVSCYTQPRHGAHEPLCQCYEADHQDEPPYGLDLKPSNNANVHNGLPHGSNLPPGTRLHNSLPSIKTDDANLPSGIDMNITGAQWHTVPLCTETTDTATLPPKTWTKNQREEVCAAYPNTTLPLPSRRMNSSPPPSNSLSTPPSLPPLQPQVAAAQTLPPLQPQVAAAQTLPPLQPYAKVSSPPKLIPVRYSSDPVPETSRIMHIEPYSRTVLSVFNSAQPADFREYAWLLRYGETELWYSKPRQPELKSLAEPRRANGEWVNGLLEPFKNPRPASLQFPKIWASAALTTPKDDDILDCNLDHNFPMNVAEGNTGGKFREHETENGACIICTDEKSEALRATPLTYYLVFTTTNVGEKDYYNGFKPSGEKIFRLLKYGSRQAAVAEAFYAAGVNGWNLAFSCVARDDEDLSKAGFVLEKVDELWQLSELRLGMQERRARVFY